MKKPKVSFEVVQSADEVSAAEFIVCAPTVDNMPLLMPDNVMDFCVECGCKVQHRPNLPAGPKHICYQCANEAMKGETEVTVMVTPKTLAEVSEYFKKHNKEE